MNFASVEFAVLFVVIMALLLIVRAPVWRKAIILSASCVFYAWWDWRFLTLLAIVTIVDYYISKALARSTDDNMRKNLLIVSIALNLGILGVFKYFNFFIDNINILFEPLGWKLINLSIILPVGISFYTFETLSYVIDVYRREAEPARSLLDYAVFITFFPRLVAGPIMRARQFLPQLERGVVLSVPNLIAGAQLFAQGLIKKLIVADRLSAGVDQVFAAPHLFSSASVWTAVAAYSIQIYFDFSGYSDMALGIGRTLGFELPQNFNLPYVAQSVTEFWRRWHISLSTWLRDYLYIPLGGNRKGGARTYINLMITMLLGGLWHGASWNFVIWGGLHGIYLAFERAVIKGQTQFPWTNWRAWLRALAIFFLVSVTWVFFRSPSMAVTIIILQKLFYLDTSGVQWIFTPAVIFVPIVVLGGWLMQALNRRIPELTLAKPYAIPLLLIEALWIHLFAATTVNPFIYFQF
jgi:alginate O-acetyltransferase complex protein AlgI